MTNKAANLFDSDRAMTVLGVAGRLVRRTTKPGDEAGALWLHQDWISERRPAIGYEDTPGAFIVAELRFEPTSCGNRHNTFSITGHVSTPRREARGDWLSGGCIHEDIAAAFPELAPLIEFHLFDDDTGPMHGVANAVYLAGDRDFSGRAAGEPSSEVEMIQFGDVPIGHRVPRGLAPFLRSLADYEREGKLAALVPIAVAHVGKPGDSYRFAPKYQFAGQPPLKWHECAFDTEDEAARFAAAFVDHSPRFYRMATAWSDGKARELDAARAAACWADATDAELCQPREALKAALEARIPALLARFRAAMTGAGFYLSPSAFERESA